MQWLKNLEVLNNQPVKYITKTSSLCGKHFRDEDYRLPNRKGMLFFDACPTIFNASSKSKRENLPQKFISVEELLNGKPADEENDEVVIHSENSDPLDNFDENEPLTIEQQIDEIVVGEEVIHEEPPVTQYPIQDEKKERVIGLLETLNQINECVIGLIDTPEEKEMVRELLKEYDSKCKELRKKRMQLSRINKIEKELAAEVEELKKPTDQHIENNVILKDLITGPIKKQYSSAIHVFATTLHCYSPPAYQFVARTFSGKLPHPNRIKSNKVRLRIWEKIKNGALPK